jgi:hypothetical protein
MATMRLTKVAMIREPGYPVGQPAPLYLNCPCGAKPRTDARDPEFTFIECACGRVYDSLGWLQRQETK